MKFYILVMFFSLIYVPSSMFTQDIQSADIENISYELIPSYELPKRYIIDGHSKKYSTESYFRRADIVFFLAIPAMYFVVQNLINIFNSFNMITENYNATLQRDYLGFTSGEWNFILAAIFLIPMGTAIYDYVYVRDYPLIPPFQQREIKEVKMNLSLYKIEF